MENKKRYNRNRGILYSCGVALLALGISLSTKTGLGTAPITSVGFSISHATGIEFIVCNFTVYTLMFIAEMIIKGKNRRPLDYLQLPFAVVFNLLLGVFNGIFHLQPDAMWQRLLLLAAAVVFCGAGVSLTVNARLVANPADALVKAISDATGKEMGLVKNILDTCCVSIAMIVDLCFIELWHSVGIGTLITMIMVGRTVYVFNRLFLKKMLRACGLE